MIDRPWPVVSYARLLAVLSTIPHITKTWANVVLYGATDGRLLAYMLNGTRCHLHPELA